MRQTGAKLEQDPEIREIGSGFCSRSRSPGWVVFGGIFWMAADHHPGRARCGLPTRPRFVVQRAFAAACWPDALNPVRPREPAAVLRAPLRPCSIWLPEPGPAGPASRPRLDSWVNQSRDIASCQHAEHANESPSSRC